MSEVKYIPVEVLCTHYKIEMSFFDELNEYGLIEFQTVEQGICIPEEKLVVLEKMIRLNQDLEINLAGIDTIFNLLDKVEELQEELRIKNERLSFYEGK